MSTVTSLLSWLRLMLWSDELAVRGYVRWQGRVRRWRLKEPDRVED